MNIASKNIFATKKINVFAIGILISLGALFSACNSESESETSKSAIDTVDTSKTLVVYSGRKEKLIAPFVLLVNQLI